MRAPDRFLEVHLAPPSANVVAERVEFGAARQALDSRVRVGPIDMLKVVRRSDDYEPWTFATLLRTSAPELDGLDPIEWMRNPDQDQRALPALALRWVREWAQ